MHEGFLPVTGGKVWYRIVGEGTGIPLLALHGGPGFSCIGMEPLEALADKRPVIFYDQLGAGRSERPDDASLWTVERFVQELGQVREGLGLDQVHLLGHSWGTMPAAEYLLTDPSGVASVIMSSPCLSASRWAADLEAYRKELPADVQAVLDRCEAAGLTDSPEYQEATMVFYKRHVCRLDPWPQSILAAFESMNPAIYNSMWGPTEFYITGSLKHFERAEALRNCTVPMLFLCGHYDEATPWTTEYYRSQVPNAALTVFEHSGHMTMTEEPERYIATVRQFLGRVEREGRGS